MIFRNCHKMMYFYMYLQSVVPESCLSGTVVKYIICLFYLPDCFQTKACCQTYILFCEFSCISHANNSFCNIRFYPLLHSLLYSLLPSFSYQFFRFQFQNFSTHSFLQSFLCFLRISENIIWYLCDETDHIRVIFFHILILQAFMEFSLNIRIFI